VDKQGRFLGYVYRWLGNGNVIVLHGRGGAGDTSIWFPGDADDGQWHLLAFVWQGTNVRCYQDGVTNANAAKSNFPAQEFSQLVVGGCESASRLIDEVKVFDRPLSEAEIKAMYQEIAGTDTGLKP